LGSRTPKGGLRGGGRGPNDAGEARADTGGSRCAGANAAFLQAARSTFALLVRPRGLTTAIRRIAASALIVQGTHDRLVPLAASRALAPLRPDWTLAVFDGVGHVPQLEAPECFVTTLVDWLLDAGAVAAAG
jgi:pimeloyl-ACP methyl ester carboxylesterase